MICGECKYCKMFYDKLDWEVFGCSNESGRGCESWDDEACKYFMPAELTDEDAIKKCLNCPKPDCDNCMKDRTEKRKKGWEQWQIDHLLSHPNDSIKQLADVLGKKEKAICARRKKMGLVTKTIRKYTADEDAYILSHTARESADYLGTTVSAITSRKHFLKCR